MHDGCSCLNTYYCANNVGMPDMNSWLFSNRLHENPHKMGQAAKRARFMYLNCWRRNKIHFIPLFMFCYRLHGATVVVA